jgi:hypothetical protein
VDFTQNLLQMPITKANKIQKLEKPAFKSKPKRQNSNKQDFTIISIPYYHRQFSRF